MIAAKNPARRAALPQGTATRYSNEVREFYTAGADVL